MNHKKREAMKREEQAQLEKIGVNQYYGIGAILALRVIGALDYYIYQTKKGEVSQEVPNSPTPQNPPLQQPSRPQEIAKQVQTNKFEME